VPARLATCVAFLSLLAAAVAGGAAGVSEKNYQTKVDAVRPAVQGLQVTAQGGDRYLVVRNNTGKIVAIQGYDGEPYLRFLQNGDVLANANSPAKYLNAIRFGTPDTVTIPRSALTGQKPKWVKVSSGGSYKWFDHRIHWMERQPPPVVKDRSKRTKIFDWKIAGQVGSTPVTIAGTLSWVPVGSSSSGLSAGAIAAIAVAALVLLAVVALMLRRRVRPAPVGPPEENRAEEAW
jgi:hypothetical protein